MQVVVVMKSSFDFRGGFVWMCMIECRRKRGVSFFLVFLS